MRRLTLLVLVLAACGGTTEAPPSTSSTTVAQTTSTTVTATTTTSEPVGLELLTRFARLEPGVRYLHEGWPGQIVAPFVIEVGLSGWRVDEIGSGFVQFRNGETDPGIRAAVVAFMPNESVATVIDDLTSPQRAADLTEPQPIAIGKVEGVTADLSVLVDLDNVGVPPNLVGADTACIGEGAVLFEEGTGQEQSWFQILAGCAWNRVWVLDVDGLSMTVTVSPDVLSRDTINELSELGLYPDDFINAITFCTEATPCDD